MLAEKELQGCEQRDKTSARTSFAPCTSVPSRVPKVSNFRMPPPTDKRPAVSGVPTAANKPPSRATKSGKTSVQVPAQSSSSVASTGSSSGIQCHRCHGLGHVKKDCPSQRAYVAKDDGGYISTSDTEEEDVDDVVSDDDKGHVLGGKNTWAT